MNTDKEGIKRLLLIIFAIVIVVVLFFPIPYYVESPGTAEKLNSMITVDGKKDEEKGSYMLTTVKIVGATPIRAVLSFIRPYQELVSKKTVQGDSSTKEYNQMQNYYMTSSQNNAIKVALDLADVKNSIKYEGIYVMHINDNSDFKKKLDIGDIVYSIDGKEYESDEEFTQFIQEQKVGQEVTLGIIRDDKKQFVTGKLTELEETHKTGIGISLVSKTRIDSDKTIKIDSGSIGGPSAGLMFTLETYGLVSGKDLRKGREIAGTGTISLDGSVGRIGGIDKKIVAASNAGAKVFFAPDDEITDEIRKKNPNIKTNYEEAQEVISKINSSMKIVPVKRVEDAISYLEE